MNLVDPEGLQSREGEDPAAWTLWGLDPQDRGKASRELMQSNMEPPKQASDAPNPTGQAKTEDTWKGTRGCTFGIAAEGGGRVGARAGCHWDAHGNWSPAISYEVGASSGVGVGGDVTWSQTSADNIGQIQGGSWNTGVEASPGAISAGGALTRGSGYTGWSGSIGGGASLPKASVSTSYEHTVLLNPPDKEDADDVRPPVKQWPKGRVGR